MIILKLLKIIYLKLFNEYLLFKIYSKFCLILFITKLLL